MDQGSGTDAKTLGEKLSASRQSIRMVCIAIISKKKLAVIENHLSHGLSLFSSLISVGTGQRQVEESWSICQTGSKRPQKAVPVFFLLGRYSGFLGP